MTRAPGPGWSLNLCGVPQSVRKFLPEHHQKIVQTNCEKLKPILSTCRPRLRTDAPIPCSCCNGTAAHFLFPFTPACDRASCCCVAWACCSAQLLGLQHFVLSHSSHSCQQRSAACPSSFSFFSTSRADLGTSFTRQTTQHPSLHRGSATIDAFLQLKCCGSCDLPFFRHTDCVKTACVCALKYQDVQELRTVCASGDTHQQHAASGIRFMHWWCVCVQYLCFYFYVYFYFYLNFYLQCVVCVCLMVWCVGGCCDLLFVIFEMFSRFARELLKSFKTAIFHNH